MTGRDGEREFSGEMRYRTCVTLDKAAHMELEFEHVGMTARLFVNGKDMGQRICAPYRWHITEAVQQQRYTQSPSFRGLLALDGLEC